MQIQDVFGAKMSMTKKKQIEDSKGEEEVELEDEGRNRGGMQLVEKMEAGKVRGEDRGCVETGVYSVKNEVT